MENVLYDPRIFYKYNAHNTANIYYALNPKVLINFVTVIQIHLGKGA